MSQAWPYLLMSSENHPQPGSGCDPRGLSCVPRAVTPSSCSCLLGGYLAYLIVRRVGHTSVTSSLSLLTMITDYLLSLIPSPPPSGGDSLPCLCHSGPSKESEMGAVGLWKHLLLAKTFRDLRVAHSLAARKVTVAASEVGRDSCHTQARFWRMAATCVPLV